MQAAIRRVTDDSGAAGEDGGGEGTQRLVIAFQPLAADSSDNEALHRKLDRFRELLGLAPEGSEFEITDMVLDRSETQIALRGRSLMGTLFFLSQSVAVPAIDEEAGRVTVTRHTDGSRFDWDTLSGKLLKIHTAGEDPVNAFVKVHYRGHWFYIGDSDLNSKTSFGLLKYLFSLQSEPGKAAPLLTLSAGG